MKNVVLVLVLVAVMIAASGCQGADGLRNDTVGALNFIGEKILKPMAEKARARDAKITAKAQAEYHAKQAALYASYDNAKDEVR
jgi:hypothetical protein